MTKSRSLTDNASVPGSRRDATGESAHGHRELIFNARSEAETAAWVAGVELMFIEQVCLFGFGD
jgi:hypothetical protein